MKKKTSRNLKITACNYYRFIVRGKIFIVGRVENIIRGQMTGNIASISILSNHRKQHKSLAI